MYKFAQLKEDEIKNTFLAVSKKIGINEAMVEKDFWICLTLDYLFNKSEWKSSIAFKGGTCLSKAYNLIERFSEDIDLIVDWRSLGYSINEPWEVSSNTKMQKFVVDSRERLFNFLNDRFVSSIKEGLSKLINKDVDLYIDEEDKGIVCFRYPSYFENESILKIIRLEPGALASWTPTKEVTIHPYIADYVQVLEISKTKILATTPERTFWEKATILHQEANRPENSTLPARYSRHYYDMYCMSKTYVKDSAIKQKDLLEKVAAFKMKFYPRGWARYDLAKIGTLKLVPAEHSVKDLKKDYEKMKQMIYGFYPSFEELMDSIQKLEIEINNINN